MKNNNYPNWLVPLDIAKQLKEIDFNEHCLFAFSTEENDLYLKKTDKKDCVWYDVISLFYEPVVPINSFLVPTWEQVFEWFREKGFDSYIGLESLPYPDEGIYYYFEISKPTLYSINQLCSRGEFDDYNEAREALVKALIQTYKNEQL